jgi:predicted TIM-barrel fold metal-dependent hydrolase
VDNDCAWVKLSAGYRLEFPQVAQDYTRALLAHAGPERLLCGSDWPFAGFEDSMRYEDVIASFRQWVPDADIRRIISGETALRLYFT